MRRPPGRITPQPFLQKFGRLHKPSREIMTSENHRKHEYWIETVQQTMRRELANRPDQSLAHRADHLERVYECSLEMAELIEKQENIVLDREALALAALLHDIHQPYDRKREHARLSAERAGELLHSLGYPSERIPKIQLLMTEHSSEDDTLPSSWEGKILFDADKLDGLGAIGIARVFARCGQLGLTPSEALAWYEKKIAKALPMLQTQVAKEMGKEDFEYVMVFIKRFKGEG